MNPPVVRLALVLSVFACVALATPQQAAASEAKASGRVLDAIGKPVANATVTWLTRPLQHWLDTGPEHRVVATTDDKGAFHVVLQADTPYSAWANWNDGATAIAEGVGGDEFVELRGAVDTDGLDVHVVGLAAWPGADAFTLRGVVGGENLDFVAGVREGDCWRFPPLPPLSWRSYELLDGDGVVLWATQASPKESRHEFVLPAPVPYRVVVHDAAGQPLAGVELLAHVCNYWITDSDGVQFGDRFRCLWPRVAVTDAAGTAVIRVPARKEQECFALLARRDGYRMSIGGVTSGKAIVDGAVPADAAPLAGPAPTLPFTLQPAPPVALPLRRPDGAALATGVLVAGCRLQVPQGQGKVGLPLHQVLPLVDGAMAFGSPLPDHSEVEFAAVQLAPRLRAEVAKQHGVGLPRDWLLRERDDMVLQPREPWLPESALRAVQVVAADGRPAAHCVVLAAAKGLQHRLQRTDRLGRALVVAAEGTRLLVLGQHGYGAAVVEPGSATIVLELAPFVAMPVRVTDAAGAAIVSERLGVDLRLTSKAEELPAELQLLLLQLTNPTLHTDADGVGRLRLPPRPWGFLLHLRDAAGRLGKVEFDLDPAKPARLDIQLDGGKR